MLGKERNLGQNYPKPPNRESMALDRARLILQGIVDTPTEDISLIGDYELRVGHYNAEEIREAFTAIGTNLLESHPHKDKLINLSMISKSTPHGRLAFGIVFGGTQVKNADYISVRQPLALRMELTTGEERKYILESAVFLKDRRDPLLSDIPRSFERFADWRGKNPPDITFMTQALEDTSKGFMDRSQKIHSSLKWVAYNMLNWDNDFKLPEDINKSPLPSTV